jgi:hypothetical protein
MAEINLKTLTPDTSLPTTGFLFGADSQATTDPSVYSTQTVAATLLGSTSLTGDTLTASAPVLNLAQTWNNAAVTFTGLKFNAAGSSATNSSGSSLLMDLQVGGVSLCNVDKTGGITTQGTFTSLASQPFSAGAFGCSTRLNASGFKFSAAVLVGWTTTIGESNDPLDLTLRRRGAANLQLGAPDVAAPVAQTLSMQSVVAGTSNTAGQNFTITGSQGTGSGAGGSIIFQVAPAGGSGTAQNALAAALTIDSSKNITVAGGNVWLDSTKTNGISFLSNNYIFPYNGTNKAQIYFSQYQTASDGGLYWSSTTVVGGTNDLILLRDAGGVLAQKNGTNAQELRVYETTTGSIYKAILGNRQLIKISGASFDNGAAAQIGTLSNSPTAGNPTKWIPIDDNGTTRYIPAW